MPRMVDVKQTCARFSGMDGRRQNGKKESRGHVPRTPDEADASILLHTYKYYRAGELQRLCLTVNDIQPFP